MPLDLQYRKEGRKYYNNRLQRLKTEYSSFESHHREIAAFIKPRRGRFSIYDRNKGDKRFHAIINSKATEAHRVAVAGMLAGTMSPSRPWFNLQTHNPDLMESHAVKVYLEKVERIMYAILAQSNFYGAAADYISELLLFGTAAMMHVNDFEDVARFYTSTIGSFYIGQNDRQVVDSLYEEFQMPAIAMVQKFGIENVSRAVKHAVERGNHDGWFPVSHAIEPNDQYRPDSPFATDMQYRQVYWEPASDGEDENKFLTVSGFSRFPAYVTRWETTGQDIYGTDCPGMNTLGDVKSLQLAERRKFQAVDRMVRPTLTGPPSLRNGPGSQNVPGGYVMYDQGSGAQKLEPLYTVNPQVQEMRFDIQQIEQRIQSMWFNDLFLAITNMEGIQPRNQLDLTQRNEERLLQLGPVLQHMQGSLQGPMIDRLFDQCVEAQILPPTPEELQNQNLQVEYIGPLAIAQRSSAVSTVDRLVTFAMNMAQVFPDALDKVNARQAVDEYAEAIGAPMSVVRSDEEVEQKDAERAAAAQQQQAQETAMGAADAASNLAGAGLIET